jgi:lysophospholipase L1-like esterase
MNIEQVDLMPVLERSLATYYDGFHATPTGAQVVAGEIAAAIQRSPAQNRSIPCVDLLAS